MSEVDNSKQGIGITISSQLITASLAMITILAGFATYTLDKKEPARLYYLILFVSFFSFVASIYKGGKGMSEQNRPVKTANHYDWQAKWCIAGLAFFIISIFFASFSKDKKDDLISSVIAVESKNSRALETLASEQKRIEHLDSLVKYLSNRLDSVNSKR